MTMAFGFAAIPDAPRYRLANARAPLALVTSAGLAAGSRGPRADRHHDRGRPHRLGRRRPARRASTTTCRPSISTAAWCCPRFVDIHTHLDKGHIWPRRPNPDGTFMGALDNAGADREANWTAADVRARMDFALRCAYAHGTGALRTHLNSDRPQTAISWPVFAELREDWAAASRCRRVSLFPIDIVLGTRPVPRRRRDDGAPRRRARRRHLPGPAPDEATDRGARPDRPGGGRGGPRPRLPCRRDRRARGPHAGAHRRRGDPQPLHGQGAVRPLLLARAAGRTDDLARVVAKVAEARLAVVSLPMCNIYLQDRRAGPHAALARRDAAARAARPPACPSWSRPTTRATRSTPMAISTCWRCSARRRASSISTIRRRTGPAPSPATPAELMGLDRHGRIEAGDAADLVLFRARSLTELLARPQADRTVLRRRTADRHDAAGLSRTRRRLSWQPGMRRAMETDDRPLRHRRPEGAPRRHQDRGQSGARAAEEPRLLLVLAGPEAPARPCHRRPRRQPDERGGGDRSRSPPPSSSASRSRRAAPAPAITARPCRSPAASCSTSPINARQAHRAGPRRRRARRRHRRRSTGRRGRIPAQEIRLHPSTYNTASIGGFIAGGSGGVGSISWGGLRDAGNILRLKVVTMEAEPRVLELTGDDLHKVSHAYGTNGIITEVEMPLAPAYDWVDVIVGFDTLCAPRRPSPTRSASRTGSCSRSSPSSRRRSPHDYFLRHQKFLPRDKHVALADGRAACARPVPRLHAPLPEARDPVPRRTCSAEADKKGLPPVFELSWNHTTLRALRVDPAITYLQVLYPFPNQLELVERIHARFGDEVPGHLEFVRFDGKVTCFGLPLVRFTTEERLDEIMRDPRGQGRADLQPAPLHAGGRRHEADRRGAARLQARGRSARACSTPAR